MMIRRQKGPATAAQPKAALPKRSYNGAGTDSGDEQGQPDQLRHDRQHAGIARLTNADGE